MVSKKISGRKTRKIKLLKIIGGIFLGVFVLTLSALIAIKSISNPVETNDSGDESAVQNSDETEVESEPAEPIEIIEKINFQPVVDSWVSKTGGNKGILIYDLASGEAVGSYNAEQNFNTASLYKLFVVYEGYRRVENGVWDGEAKAGSTGKTILKCLDLAIRESNSPCAETLWNMIGHAELDQIIRNDFGILNSNISNLSSNPNDIAKMMQRFYEHPDIQNPELIALMFDSFLNQPKTNYDWRRGLPSGFSGDVKVYNKVGWDWSGSYWKVYHDAAIVDFPLYGRSFIVVVMTSKVKHQEIGEFAKMLEAEFLSQIQ